MSSALTTRRITWEVALLAEGVDRNHKVEVQQFVLFGRPPRGGRG